MTSVLVNAVGSSSNPMLGYYGGTGVNNAAFTMTYGGNVAFSGSYTTTFTVTGNTTVTLPTSGTLVNTAVTALTSLASVGTIGTGVWQGTVIGATYGGTGVNNGSSTITIGGNVTLSGAYTFTGTLTNTTSVTFPTSGTLATTTGTFSGILQDYTETNTAANSSTSYAINMALGNVFTITLTGSCTLSMSNVPASGCASLTIVLIQGSGPYTVTWPAAFIWAGGTAPTLTTTNGHVDVFTAITTNAGTTFRAFTAGQNFAS